MLASRAGRPGYCIVLSFGTNDLPRFPLYTAASYSPAKTRKGLQESPKATTMTTTRMGKGKGNDERKWGKGQPSRAIWEVLHIYGLLVPARKQISGKSRSEITLEPLGCKAAPFSSGRISAFATPEYYFPGKWHELRVVFVPRSTIRWILRRAYCELNVKYFS